VSPPAPQASPDTGREVFRSPGSIVLSLGWLVLAVVLLIDLAVQGHSRIGLIGTVLVVAISGILYGCAWRPRIVADAGGVTLVNPLRDHLVPWGSVVKVDAVHALRVHCAPVAGSPRGKIVSSWAIQASPRSALRASRRGRLVDRRMAVPAGYGRRSEPQPRSQDAASAQSTAARLEERAQRARQAGAEGGQPVARWAWSPIAVMALPVLAFVIVLAA
jgi:Bacterial PH domain